MSDDHQVVLMNHTVFQPRGVSCVSESDVVLLSNKQYTRKSYQSTMDLSKELQLDANAFSDEIPSDPGDGSSCVASPTDDKERGNVSCKQKVPPQKPPRKIYMSDEIIVKPNRPQQVEGQGRPITQLPSSPLSPIDYPPGIEAGSRVSSFNPMSSFKPRGHSRSKSESLKTTELDINKQDSSAFGEAMSDISKETLLPSSLSLESKKSRSPSPRNKTLPSSPSTAEVENSYDYHSNEDTKLPYCTLPRLILSEEGRITGNLPEKHQIQEDIYHSPARSENIDDDTKLANEVDKEGVSKAIKIQFDSILKELNTHNLRPGGPSPVSANAVEECAVTGASGQEQTNDSKPVDIGALSLETPFTLSKMSKSNHSQRVKPRLRDRLSKRLAHSTTKANNQIRNSSFVSHDEDGSISENKPSSHSAQSVASEASNVVQADLPMESFIRPTRVLNSSEQDESPNNDDTGEMSPTWHCDDDCSDCKNNQDPDKVDAELLDPEQFPGQPLSPPQENLRLSYITENLHEFSDSIKREGFLHRTFYTRDGKKLRKNWTHSYARYIEHPINSGSTAFLYFSKTKDVEKKAEIFEFVTPCYLEHVSDKKTSRQQVLGSRNSNDTEVLSQFDDREIAQEWIKDLKTQKGMEYIAIPEKEEKKGKKGSEKIKRETSLEQLNPDNKGIKDKLRNFIKRRPMKETLEHKGIYKESVFGSTLAELKSQDKTNTPLFVLCCIKNIEDTEENSETDGLYRISGNAAQIQKIRFEVAQRRYTVLGQEKEIHNSTGASKSFFRELKEPSIPFDNYKEFIYATGSEYRKANQQADKLMKAVNKSPTENYETSMILMEHLLRVSKHEPQNRMSLSNSAIVFGPCIMWPRETQSADIMTNVMLHNRVVEGLLADFDKIFTKKSTM